MCLGHTVAAFISDLEHTKSCRPQHVVQLRLSGCDRGLLPTGHPRPGPVCWRSAGLPALWLGSSRLVPGTSLNACTSASDRLAWSCSEAHLSGSEGFVTRAMSGSSVFLVRQLTTCRLCLLLQPRREQNRGHLPLTFWLFYATGVLSSANTTWLSLSRVSCSWPLWGSGQLLI